MRTTSLLSPHKPHRPFWRTLWCRLIGEQIPSSVGQSPTGEEARRRSAAKPMPTSGSSSKPAALTGAELTRLINNKPFARGRSIHLVIVEQTLRSARGGELRLVPADVISHAILQLEELLIDQDSPLLHQLMADMIRMNKPPVNPAASAVHSDGVFYGSTPPVLQPSTAPFEQPAWQHLAPTVVHTSHDEQEPLDGQDGFPDTVAESAVHRPVNHAINRPSGLLW